MSDKFTVEIISPEHIILKQQTSEVIIPSFEGNMGILKDHIPLITFLRPGFITIKADKVNKYYVEEGTVEFSNNSLLILTSSVKNVENFEKNLISSLVQDEVKKLNDPKVSDKERYISTHKIQTLKEISQ